MIRIAFIDLKCHRIIIRGSLNDTIEVIGVETHHKSIGIACVFLELRSLEPHVNKDSASIVHRNHTNTVGIEGQVHLYENTLESLYECAEGSSLNGLRLD
jgi:hypothetical protein